jgi:HAD superfamily hydrolase (TIGR01450 family)
MPFNLPVRLDKESAHSLIKNVDNFLFDCDGVIWNWPHAIDGSVECINRLKSLGKKCFFVSNNSTKTRQDIIEMLHKIGIDNVTSEDIVCTAWVLAGYLKTNNFTDKVYVIGSDAVAKELDAANIRHVGIGPTTDEFPDPARVNYKKVIKLDPDVKCVTVAFDYYISYPKMVIATSYAHNNPECQFIATNDDAVFPDGGGSKVVIPGTGTLISLSLSN